MPNLKKKKHSHVKAVFQSKPLVIFLAIVLVVAINFVTFSYLLKDREKARAFDVAFAASLFKTLAGGDIQRGASNVLIADFMVPGAFGDSSLIAGGGCDFSLNNPCIPMIDADGQGTFGQGADDDGLTYLSDFFTNYSKTNDVLFKQSDNVCADNLDPRLVEDIYLDGDGDCVPGSGGNDWGILDKSGDGFGAGPYTNVSNGISLSPQPMVWVHSEEIENDQAYNYYADEIYYENTGLCGSAGGPWDPNFDPMWREVNNDATYTPGVDLVYWDNANCLTTGPCANGCAGAGPLTGPAKPLFYDGGGACGGTPGDGIWQSPEPFWDDRNQNGTYEAGTDNILWDGTGCLAGGETGVLMHSNPEAFTETIWVLMGGVDNVLAQGNYWNDAYLGQWQGDLFTPWTGNERFVDLDATTAGGFDGIATEPMILDLDGDNLYADGPDTLLDADGSATAGTGTDDDAIAPGTGLSVLAATDNVCLNTAGQGGVGQVIIYVDGSDLADDGLNNGSAADCIPGNSGTDTLIRDDTGTGLAAMAAGLGTFPYTFINPANAVQYYDADTSGTWTWGAGAAATESLWLDNQGVNQWHPNIEGTNGAIEADGTGSLAIPGVAPNIDDDGLIRGNPLTYLQASDNVCIALTTTSIGFEDIYIDGSGINGECIPGNGGVDTLLMDRSADGLNPATTFDGNWASPAGFLAYHDHLGGANGAWDWGANAANTESLWLENWGTNIYTASADTDVYSTGLAVAGDSLIVGLGPNGGPLGYVDADSSGGLTANDTVVEDIGFIQTGPAGAPNGVIDRIEEVIDYFSLKNLGTADNNDITTLKIYNKGPWWGGNGVCDSPVGSVDDQLEYTLNWNSTLNGWETGKRTPGASNVAYTISGKCLAADISPAAGGYKTIQLQAPQLVDNNANGLYDVGDQAFMFVYSAFDAITGGSHTLPYTFTIVPPPSYGEGTGVVPDTTAPANISNIVLTADDSGQVVITWNDPPDTDLSQIIIEEKAQDQVVTEAVAAGEEILILNGRIVGQTYEYTFRTKDNSGNLSSAITASIQIPDQGEVIVDVPEPVLPAPIGPGLPEGIEQGDLIKSTTEAAVYVVGSDNQKHHFPNETVYYSWYLDFSGLKILSQNVVDEIETGTRVTVRPGTWLIKNPTDPKVYAVEPGNVIRWIENETIAKAIYGADWNDRVVDLSDNLFADYSEGAIIDEGLPPTGSLIQYSGETDIYYIENQRKRLVSPEAFEENLFREKFVIKNVPKTTAYFTGTEFPAMGIEVIMALR